MCFKILVCFVFLCRLASKPTMPVMLAAGLHTNMLIHVVWLATLAFGLHTKLCCLIQGSGLATSACLMRRKNVQCQALHWQMRTGMFLSKGNTHPTKERQWERSSFGFKGAYTESVPAEDKAKNLVWGLTDITF